MKRKERILRINGGTTSYMSNSLNQYTSVGGTGYSYDDNGNLTDDGTYDYYYDCENRLTDVNEGASKIASYEYDYRGRRISKTDYTLNPVRYTLYCYDEDHVIAEYENGTLVRKFIYGPGIDEPIMLVVRIQETEYRYYYHFDGLGSVVALSDENADIVEQYSYDVFGEPTIRDANDQIRDTSQYGNPYMFTGRNYDDETGLYYYRARYYKPEIGRFLQTDPIGYVDGMNFYTYVGNNPINKVDPEGMQGYYVYMGPCGPVYTPTEGDEDVSLAAWKLIAEFMSSPSGKFLTCMGSCIEKYDPFTTTTKVIPMAGSITVKKSICIPPAKAKTFLLTKVPGLSYKTASFLGKTSSILTIIEGTVMLGIEMYCMSICCP